MKYHIFVQTSANRVSRHPEVLLAQVVLLLAISAWGRLGLRLLDENEASGVAYVVVAYGYKSLQML